MTLEMVYIGEHASRFIYGQVYKAIYFTEDTTTFLDKDGVPMDFSNDVLHHWFRQKAKWREEQIDKILSILDEGKTVKKKVVITLEAEVSVSDILPDDAVVNFAFPNFREIKDKVIQTKIIS